MQCPHRQKRRLDVTEEPGHSLPARNEWGESWREGNLNKTRLLSPALSSFLRQEEREKCFRDRK